jgi:hypothetical protein
VGPDPRILTLWRWRQEGSLECSPDGAEKYLLPELLALGRGAGSQFGHSEGTKGQEKGLMDRHCHLGRVKCGQVRVSIYKRGCQITGRLD